MEEAKRCVEELLQKAGITINGDKEYDITVHDDRFYKRIIRDGSLGLGESYMDGRRDCPQLDVCMTRILNADLGSHIRPNIRLAREYIQAIITNKQSKTRAANNVASHYDLPASFYMDFLDKYNQYSCGYFKNTDDLDQAQLQKLDLICKKLQLTKGDRVLDIGCGRGGLARYMAENYECHVTGISLSKEQVSYAKEATKGLPVQIEYCDYRDHKGTYNKIVSVGMLEHVGYKNYRTFMLAVSRLLEEQGLFLLHTIGGNTSVKKIDARIDKYIFPGAVLPSMRQLTTAFEGVFVMEDRHNFGPYYDKTLMARYYNFSKHLDKIKNTYGERFIRMQNYYFLCCAATFRSRMNQLRQIVLSPKGISGGYQSIR